MQNTSRNNRRKLQKNWRRKKSINFHNEEFPDPELINSEKEFLEQKLKILQLQLDSVTRRLRVIKGNEKQPFLQV